MVEELPEEVKIGTIELEPGIPFYYEAWGVVYKFRGLDWQVAQVSFTRKSDAEDWLDKNLRYEGMEGGVVPVKRTLLLTYKGDIQSQVEELD